MAGRRSYINTADTSVAAEVVETVGLAAGTVALQHGLGLAAVDAAGYARVGGTDDLGAAQAVGELVQLGLGVVLWGLPLFAHIAADPASCQTSYFEAMSAGLLGREVGEVPPEDRMDCSQ